MGLGVIISRKQLYKTDLAPSLLFLAQMRYLASKFGKIYKNTKKVQDARDSFKQIMLSVVVMIILRPTSLSQPDFFNKLKMLTVSLMCIDYCF